MHLLKLLRLLPISFLVALPASAQTLKASATTASEIVTLGDLVANAGLLASTPIFRSPDLGQTGNVSAQQIVDAARTHGLNVDAQGLGTVAVTRSSRELGQDDLLVPMKAALAARAGLTDPESIGATLDAGFESMHLPVEATGPVIVAELNWQVDRGTFDAAVTISRNDGRTERRALRGRAAETVPVVVASHAIERGAVITEADVETVRKAKSEARGDVMNEEKPVIGQEVRRAVREGQVLRSGDLAEPQIVKRSQMVTIIHQVGALTLTASGQAMRDATRGETVQVMNIQSKRVLQAIATGPNQVTVTLTRALASTAR